MTPIVLDFETYYDSDYSLSKMPTQQYIRDSRFRCLGAAVSWAERPGGVWLPAERLDEFFDRLTWSQVELVCHNAQFDYTLLRHHWPHLPKPARVFCTRDAARWAVSQGLLPPDQRVSLRDLAPRYGITKGDTAQAVAAGGAALAGYATSDAAATWWLYAELSPHIPTIERELIDLHARQLAEPCIVLDTAKLRELANTPPDPMAEKLRSKETFAKALRLCGIEPWMKEGARGPAYAFAKTDAFMQWLAEHEDPRVQMLHALRVEGTSNIVRTRAQRLLDIGSPLGAPLAYYAAHTGRAGGRDINLQNLPARDPNALALRESLMAPEGHSFIIADSAQVEVRVNAWLAGERWLLDALSSGADPYTTYAKRALGKAEITKEERQWAKAPVLAFMFGQGPGGYQAFCQQSGIPMDAVTAEKECTEYRAAHRAIVSAWQRHLRAALTGEVVLPSGRKLTYPNVRRLDGEFVYTRPAIFRKGTAEYDSKLWHGSATENLVQAVARDVVMEQVVRCVREGLQCVMTVHDEGVFVVKDDEIDEAKTLVSKAFNTAPEWAAGLPVAGSVKVSKRYGK